MITKKQYVEYLASTPKNCTCTYLAEHLEGVSHDVVNDFLREKRFLPGEVWKLAKGRIEDSPDAVLIVDDSVHDKRYSRFISLVRAQYSGNEHGVVRGMGVVSLVHSAGKEAAFYPIDYRVYAPEVDGKTKNTHFQEMFKNALTHKQLQARTIVFDSWYASAANWKLIHRRARIFFTTLKSNRLVSLSKEEGYIHLTEVEWTPERLARGVIVKLKEVPFQVRLFKLVAPDGDIDWVITNDLDETVTAQVAKDSSDVRWQVEEVHRGLKQLTGSEKCQCRGGSGAAQSLGLLLSCVGVSQSESPGIEANDVRTTRELVPGLSAGGAPESSDPSLFTQLSVSPDYVAALLDVRIGPDLQGGFRVADAFAKHSPETELVFNSAYFGEEDPIQFFERFATFLVFEREVERGPELRTAILGAIRAYEKAAQDRTLLEQIEQLGSSVEDLLSHAVERELTEMEVEDTRGLPSFSELFRLYQAADFLYPEKLAALLPHYEEVQATWERLSAANNMIGKTLVRRKNGILKNAASAFEYAPGTWLTQHLASVERREYIGTLSVLVGLFRFLHGNPAVEFCRLTHIANHPAVSPLFSGLADALSPSISHYQTYDWIFTPLSQLRTQNDDASVTVHPMENSDTATHAFLKEHLGSVVYEALRFASDPELTDFGTRVSRFGLERGRKIFTAEYGGQLTGAVICNTGSLGMNFSFHENTTEIVIDPLIDHTAQACVFQSLVSTASDYYASQGRHFLVGLFDPAHRAFRQSIGLTMKRERQFSMLTWGRGEEESFHATCDYYIQFYTDLLLRRNQNRAGA